MTDKRGLIVFALKEEFVSLFIPNTQIEYVFSGIGKTKASMTLTKSILEFKPDFVLNIGTVGSLHHSVGDIVVCKRFIDRDLRPLVSYGVNSEVSFSAKSYYHDIPLHRILSKCNDITKTCNTGDSFVTDATNIEGDVVDMEAFAHAVVCESFQIPYLSVKYVTDIIGDNSVQQWESKLKDARIGLTKWFEDLNWI